MYRLGENHIKRRHRHIAILVVVIVLAVVLSVIGTRALRAQTAISPPPPATNHSVSAPSMQTKHIDESLFSIDLPTDWKLQQHQTTTGDIYIWINTAGNAGVRNITLYIDTPEPQLGVNRALFVQNNDNRLTAIKDVSDNCAGFTGPSASASSGTAPAKWNGADFLCDLANYTRDVVGTVSQDGINEVMITGPTAGRHSIFLTYTDNSSQPDYAIFINALQSLQLK